MIFQDLGTAYSRVSVTKNFNRVEILRNEHASHVTPSYVAFTRDGYLVGDPAKNQAADNPVNTIFDVKYAHSTRRFENSTVWSLT